jgi:anaerobic magnesium-protoporphyrin IX monomethyl ester cyclase
VQHMPLSLLYASVDSITSGFGVDIVDVRLHSQRWEDVISTKITSDTILVGISVMTGTPIKNALEISRWTKNRYPHISIVWGGPHATFNGRQILDEPSIDFVISGYGSLSLSLLAKNLANDKGAPALSEIRGLLYREKGAVQENLPEAKFETFNYRDIPYHLIKGDMDLYGQLDSGERIFSIYSAMGCPYNCGFCSSPAQYKKIKKKYEAIPASEVVDHIEYVHKEYQASYIYFIDDDSFVDIEHVENIINEINRRGISVRLGFRGARINEIKKMSDGYLNKLANAGTNILHIGAESGSQSILDMIHKNCTVDDIIEVNRKLARHPEITAAYNWIVGLPEEKLHDLYLTRKLILRIIKDNRRAIIFIPNKYRPLPGTALYNLALKHGYIKPKHIEDWIEIEAENNYCPPWYSKKAIKIIHMMQVTSFFIDSKITKVNTGNTFRFKMARLMAFLYSPVAKIRFKYGISAMLIEYKIFHWASLVFAQHGSKA